MSHRLKFAGKKLVRIALLLLGVSLAAFLLMSASPLDPLQTNIGQTALGSMRPEQVEKLRAYWGADTPPVQRYLGWLSAALRGDFGVSQRLCSSLGLLVFSWVLSGALGFTLGVLSGAFQGRWPDKIIRGYCLLISSTPAFWLALLLMMVFSVWLGWFPIGFQAPVGVDAASVSLTSRLYHAVLPAAALSVTGAANIALHTREKMVEVMGSDYVLFARARGESLGVIVWRHGIRNVA